MFLKIFSLEILQFCFININKKFFDLLIKNFLEIGSETKSEINELNISNIELDNDLLSEVDLDTYKDHLDKHFDEKKNQLLKYLQISNSNTIINEEEEKFKEDVLKNNNFLKLEEDKKIELEKSQKLQFLEDEYNKKYRKECKDINIQINKKIAESKENKKYKNYILEENIKKIETEIEQIKIKLNKTKEDQEKYIANQYNNYGDELEKEEIISKRSLQEFKIKKENELNIKKQNIIIEYDKKISESNRQINYINNIQLTENEVNEINYEFKDKKQTLIFENEEKFNRAKDEIIQYYNKLFNDERVKVQESSQIIINSLLENTENIKEYFQNQINIYNIENEISLFSQIPNKIIRLNDINNEMFYNLSNFHKLIFQKLFKELENNKDFVKIKNKEKIYRLIYEYFTSIILRIILQYSIKENKEIKELLDILIDKFTINMDKILTIFQIDKRVQLSIEIKETNLLEN